MSTTRTTAPKVSIGVSTILGIAAAIGTVIAAIHGNDAATAVSGASTLVMMLGRYGQAIETIRAGAKAIEPYVDAVAKLPDQR